jgi:hypothetical protein
MYYFQLGSVLPEFNQYLIVYIFQLFKTDFSLKNYVRVLMAQLYAFLST